MRILLYGLNYAPELTGIGKYTGEMGEWLADQGHDVRVVTAPPYYPAWRVWPGYKGGSYMVEDEDPNAPEVHRCPIWVPTKPTGIKRMLHLLSFALSSLPVAAGQWRWKPQVVFAVEPAFFCAPGALLAAWLARAPAWLHVQDFEVDAAFELALLPTGGWLQRFALGFERTFTLRFDRVSSISPNMVERSIAKGLRREQAVLFPNWVDTDAIRPADEEAAEANLFRRKLRLEPGKVVLLYSGNMGNKQGLEVLAPLARSFAEDAQVHFVFCGDGAFRPQLEAAVEGMANVSLLPLQPLERLNDLLNAADIHLLPQKQDAADLVMPSKLTGMLASGRPVLATAARGTQVAEVVSGRGFALPTQDIGALHDAVRTLVNDPELRRRMGGAARAYAVEHLGREQVLRRFESELERLAMARSGASSAV